MVARLNVFITIEYTEGANLLVCYYSSTPHKAYTPSPMAVMFEFLKVIFFRISWTCLLCPIFSDIIFPQWNQRPVAFLSVFDKTPLKLTIQPVHNNTNHQGDKGQVKEATQMECLFPAAKIYKLYHIGSLLLTYLESPY